MIKIGLVGATGYTGVELLRLLSQHPDAELLTITSRSEAGTPVADLFPNLRGKVNLLFADPDKAPLAKCQLVFFAAPNGVAMHKAGPLLDKGVRVIDLSADFRIKDPKVWEKWYGMPHASANRLGEAVYGLPEVHRVAIRAARLVANPGCYPTAILLGFLPLVEAGVVDTAFLIADAKSGVSGAGRKAELHLLYSEAADNFQAYAASGHRHWPEIIQGLSGICATPLGLTFVPHLAPMLRGIHATLYASLRKKVDVQALYEQRYRQEPFVDVLPAGRHPDTRSVRASNTCRIALHLPEPGNVVVILSVIDNLVKGAAGQAIQNMNIMFDLTENTGLDQIAVLP